MVLYIYINTIIIILVPFAIKIQYAVNLDFVCTIIVYYNMNKIITDKKYIAQ